MDVQVPAFWNKFKNKFGLMQSHSEVIPLNKSIQPVSVIDDLLVLPQVVQYTYSVTGAGSVLLTTIPDNEIWSVSAYSMYAPGSNFKYDTFFLRESGNIMYLEILDDWPARVTSGLLSPPVNLPPKTEFYFTVVNFSAAGTAKLRFLRSVIKV